jgi:hypothetical protein
LHQVSVDARIPRQPAAVDLTDDVVRVLGIFLGNGIDGNDASNTYSADPVGGLI